MSQQEHIFQILKDGAWHATFDIVRQMHVGPIMNLKGRISDLKNKEHCNIESHNDKEHCERFGLDREHKRSMWWYRMTSWPGDIFQKKTIGKLVTQKKEADNGKEEGKEKTEKGTQGQLVQV